MHTCSFAAHPGKMTRLIGARLAPHPLQPAMSWWGVARGMPSPSSAVRVGGSSRQGGVGRKGFQTSQTEVELYMPPCQRPGSYII